MPPDFRLKSAALALSVLAAAGAGLHAQAPGAAADRAVMLPAMVVQGAAWRYAQPAGFEVISLWSDSRTRTFANALLSAKQLFDLLLPPEFQAQFSVPTAYVLVPDNGTESLSAPLMAELLSHAKVPGSTPDQQPSVRFLPNLLLWDRDSLVVFVQSSPSINDGHMVFSNDRVALALERRVPALPGWFSAGFLTVYNAMEYGQDDAGIGPAGWMSRDQATALAEDPESPRQLLPLADLFAGPVPGGPAEAPTRALLRREEAALFIRWALDGDGAPHKAALWKFVSEASAGPVSEGRFEALFGEDYVSVLNDLSDYLPWALTHSLRLTSVPAPVDTEIRMRDATPAEVGRIKGDWERLEMNRVALEFPQLAPRYREHAQETLRLAYQENKTDPGLLAVMALFDLDCGKPGPADPYLRTAAAGRVVRPRVYYELARMLFSELIKAQPDSAQAHLTPIQAATLLGLLDQARAQSPALPEVYGLYFAIAEAAAAQPTPALLNVFSDGARLFPGNAPLIYDAAVMLARSGDIDAANNFLQKGLGVAAEPALRTRMARLQAALAPALKSQSGPPAVQ
jgi:hypothetical protein